MKILMLLSFISATTWAAESVSLSRYFTIKTCYKNEECLGPTVKNIESANVKLNLSSFNKGGVSGLHAWDRSSMVEDSVPFKSEIHLIKHTKPGKYKYYLYAMLRSGKGRPGAVKMIHLKDLSELKDVVLTDDPIEFGGGTLQA